MTARSSLFKYLDTATAPDEPFFLYAALRSTHEPLNVAKGEVVQNDTNRSTATWRDLCERGMATCSGSKQAQGSHELKALLARNMIPVMLDDNRDFDMAARRIAWSYCQARFVAALYKALTDGERHTVVAFRAIR